MQLIFFPKYFSDLGGGMVYLCGKKKKKVNGGVHAYFLSVCPACCACALRANVTMCQEDRHPPGKCGKASQKNSISLFSGVSLL